MPLVWLLINSIMSCAAIAYTLVCCSKHAKNIVPLPGGILGSSILSRGGGDDDDDAGGSSSSLVVQLSESDRELGALKTSLAGTELVGALAGLCKTLDQAKAVLTFAEAIAEKTLRSTVALTAGRGRGKSAALGLAIAAAIGYGYANVFVTSPNPENLKVCRHISAVGHIWRLSQEHTPISVSCVAIRTITMFTTSPVLYSTTRRRCSSSCLKG